MERYKVEENISNIQHCQTTS